MIRDNKIGSSGYFPESTLKIVLGGKHKPCCVPLTFPTSAVPLTFPISAVGWIACIIIILNVVIIPAHSIQ